MTIKIGYEVYYKPENNRKYRVSKITMSYGKKYAHLVPADDPNGKALRTVLPFSDVYFAFPDNINDILAEF